MNHDRPRLSGWPRLRRAAGYSWAGLKAAWQAEEAFRLEALLCLILTPIGLWLGQNGVERVLLLGSLVLVVITELFNSGIEAAIDRIGPESHELSGRAKDIASAAVAVALVNVVLVWVLVLL